MLHASLSTKKTMFQQQFSSSLARPLEPLFITVTGQWCHTFCTYCFRWAQFTAVGSPQAFQSYDANGLASYIRKHKGILFCRRFRSFDIFPLEQNHYLANGGLHVECQPVKLPDYGERISSSRVSTFDIKSTKLTLNQKLLH